MCPANLDQEQRFRRRGNKVIVSDVSVKPGAIVRSITDPEVLFQFFLFSAEGKHSRILQQKYARLARSAESAYKYIDNADELLADLVTFLYSVRFDSKRNVLVLLQL